MELQKIEIDEIGETENQCASEVFLKIIKSKCKTTLIVLIETGSEN